MLNMIKFTMGTMDGEGKLIPLGQLYIKPEVIVGFHSIVNDKKVLKSGCIIQTATASMLVMEDVHEVKEALESTEFQT